MCSVSHRGPGRRVRDSRRWCGVGDRGCRIRRRRGPGRGVGHGVTSSCVSHWCTTGHGRTICRNSLLFSVLFLSELLWRRFLCVLLRPWLHGILHGSLRSVLNRCITMKRLLLLLFHCVWVRCRSTRCLFSIRNGLWRCVGHRRPG